jgi:hypothetical protein
MQRVYESARTDGQPSDEISVEWVVMLIGELAIEAGMLNAIVNRMGGREEIAARDMYCQFCMLIKLLAAGGGRGEDEDGGGLVPVDDLVMLMEDEWFKAVPAKGIR